MHERGQHEHKSVLLCQRQAPAVHRRLLSLLEVAVEQPEEDGRRLLHDAEGVVPRVIGHEAIVCAHPPHEPVERGGVGHRRAGGRPHDALDEREDGLHNTFEVVAIDFKHVEEGVGQLLEGEAGLIK